MLPIRTSAEWKITDLLPELQNNETQLLIVNTFEDLLCLSQVS